MRASNRVVRDDKQKADHDRAVATDQRAQRPVNLGTPVQTDSYRGIICPESKQRHQALFGLGALFALVAWLDLEPISASTFILVLSVFDPEVLNRFWQWPSLNCCGTPSR
jgi:hypothetical protein